MPAVRLTIDWPEIRINGHAEGMPGKNNALRPDRVRSNILTKDAIVYRERIVLVLW